MSVFWFDQLAGLVPNHLVAARDDRMPAEVADRALLVRRLEMLPVECVARGYLAEAGWQECRDGGSVCGVPLPSGLAEPARLRELTLAIHTAGAKVAEDAGVVLADTKLEFGFASDGTLVLGDEVLTPDSSRSWPAESAIGCSPPNLSPEPRPRCR